MKTFALAAGLILVASPTLRADQLDDLLKKVRAGESAAPGQAESEKLLEPAFKRFGPAVGALYLAQVKASLVDPENHGGWPCRSFWLWTEPNGAPQIHAWLTQQFASKGDALYLYASLCPLIVMERQEEIPPLVEKIKARDKFLGEKVDENLKYWKDYIRENKAEAGE